MQFLYLLNLHVARYWNQVHTYQILKLVQYIYHWNQNRNKAENKCSSLHFSRGIYLSVYFRFIFDHKALFVSLKDRTCLRIAIPAYCLNIFGSIFGVLFSFLIKKLKVTVLLHFHIPLFSLMIWCRISCRLRFI